MRRTKIIATLGPATENPETIREMIRLGVNIFRLNMSHATHAWVRTIVPVIREAATSLRRNTAILMDTQGPAIRTGDLPTKLDLKVGDKFTFTVRGTQSEEVFSVDTNYDDLVNDIKVGDIVLVDNGVIHMIVREKKDNALVCEVLTPGTLGSRRHINLPGVRVNLPCLTEKDLADLKVGIECQVDWVALSFVREGADITKLREVLAADGGGDIAVMAKIEDQSAVKNIGEIVDAADAIMVARGDLGIEWPYEELPIVQRRIVKHCIRKVKPVVVATHMLESMISSPVPTRAEITDVANAVFEQADAIMLSGETTVGKYPLRCVEVLDRVAQRIERSGGINFHQEIQVEAPRDQVSASAVHLANQVGADALFVFTRTGRIARIVAGLRPVCPIMAFTPDRRLSRRLCLLHGIYAHTLAFDESPLATIELAEEHIRGHQFMPPDAKVVIVTEMLVNQKRFWTAQLRTLG
ncbi:MAG: pyruvate kinase [Candidatus Methylacidiphilales bacterium]|nr:pyruvate kinase [Candidatus Methylacidiphilales bacterium]